LVNLLENFKECTPSGNISIPGYFMWTSLQQSSVCCKVLHEGDYLPRQVSRELRAYPMCRAQHRPAQRQYSIKASSTALNIQGCRYTWTIKGPYK
jgi:hypothetical protein